MFISRPLSRFFSEICALQMINLMRAKRVSRNTILIDFSHSSTNMYILVDGRLRIFKTSEEFRTYRIVQNRSLRAGDSPK